MSTLIRPRAVLLWLAGISLVAGLLAACSSSSSSHHDGGDYLALGDSIAFGYRPTTITPAAEYADAGNFTGYPELVAKATGMSLTNASCPGESSTSLITAGVADNGCSAVSATGAAGYRSKNPLHAGYSGSQLTFAVSFLRSHEQTRLVSLDIGVNDLLVCYTVTPSHCTGSAGQAQLAETGKNVATIITALRDRAGYRGRIVLLTAYPDSYTTSAGLLAYEALDTALTAVAKKSGVALADGFGAFEKPSAAFGGDPCQAGLLIPLQSSTCDYHPSAQGQQLLANAVEAALKS